MLKIMYGLCDINDLKAVSNSVIDIKLIKKASNHYIFTALCDEDNQLHSSNALCFEEKVPKKRMPKTSENKLSHNGKRSQYRYNNNLVCTPSSWGRFFSKRDVLIKAQNRLNLNELNS